MLYRRCRSPTTSRKLLPKGSFVSSFLQTAKQFSFLYLFSNREVADSTSSAAPVDPFLDPSGESCLSLYSGKRNSDQKFLKTFAGTLPLQDFIPCHSSATLAQDNQTPDYKEGASGSFP